MTADALELTRPEQLKALGHPLRLKILQTLGDAEVPLTNCELAAALEVDPGHLHFHVRMLHRAELIELAPGSGREKPYRLVATHLRVGAEIRSAGLATNLQAAQLREAERGFELFASTGELRTAQTRVKLDPESFRQLFDELVARATELEDESQPGFTITIVGHPTVP